MKCVDRRTFLQLPPGTIYFKGERFCFEGMAIKGELFENDWVDGYASAIFLVLEADDLRKLSAWINPEQFA